MDMDIEQIIKRVAEEVYGQIRAESQRSGSAAPAAAAGADEWIYSRMQTGMRLDEVKSACAAVRSSKAKTLCIPQWFVDYAVNELKGSGIKVATAVGLPGGSTSSFAKYAEVKQAVTSGAEVVILPVNMHMCAVGDWDSARNDLAESMVPCKGRACVCAVLEVDSLSRDQLSTAAAMCAACGVDMVLLSAVIGGSVAGAQIEAVKSQGVRTGVYGGVTDSTLSVYKQSGASCYAVSRL